MTKRALLWIAVVVSGCQGIGSPDVGGELEVAAPDKTPVARPAGTLTAPDDVGPIVIGDPLPTSNLPRPTCDPTATVIPQHAVIASLDDAGRGRIDVIEVASGKRRLLDLDAGSNPLVASAGTCVYIFAKDRGEVQVLRGGDFERVSVWFLEPGSDPTGIIVVDAHKAYVALSSLRSVLIVHPIFGEVLGEVDFSRADHIMGAASSIMRLGDDVFVTYDYMQSPSGEPASGVVRIDSRNDAVVTSYLLASTAVRATATAAGQLWIATIGNGPSSSCLESIDLRGPSGCLVSGDDLGGVITGLELDALDGGVAVVRDEKGGSLVRFSKTGASKPQQLSSLEADLVDVTRGPAGTYWTGDIGVNPGVRVFSSSGFELGLVELNGMAVLNGITFTP